MEGVTPELVSHASPTLPVDEDGGDYAIYAMSLNPATLMNIPIVIGGRKLFALVDTGATVSLIRASLVDSVDPCEPKSVVGLGGTVTTSGSFSSAIEIEGISAEAVSFLVVPDSCLDSDAILGSDFFSHNRIVVDMDDHSLRQDFSVGWTGVRFSDPNGPVVTCSRLPVYALADIRVRAGETTRVPVCCARAPDGEVYFDGDLGSQYLRGVDGVLSFGGDQPVEESVHVLMTQPSHARNRAELIRRGTIVGTVSTIVDVDVECDATSSAWTYERFSEVVDLEGLSTSEALDVRTMLFSKREVFSLGDEDVGQAAVTEHHIELDDYTPIRQRPRRFPEPVVEAIESQCRELQALDIIAPSKSPWSSPVVPIRKKDGSMRLCVDYRKLNAVTKADRFPMPNMTDLVFSQHGMKFFTSLDLVRGYYQVPLADSSQELTAFSTTRNHYQFKRLSFGLKNAPAAFQRQMQEVLQGYLGKQVMVYIDDILIMSRTFKEHIELVGAVLETLFQYRIKIKVPKCKWFKECVPFLGHIVGSAGLQKAPEYVQKVLDFPKPGTVHELRQFLGLLNFQRKFMPDCSQIAQPLSRLTGGSKRDRLTWSCEMDAAFAQLRELMGRDVLLSFPDYSEGSSPLELYVDASGTGAGACLMQIQQGESRAIAYNSMTFSKPQKQYSTIDRELAAIRWGVRAFRPFLYGVHFILFTDHRPLVFMRNMSSENSRIARTLQELGEFDFELRYCRGEENSAADALSRMTRVEEPAISDLVKPDYLPVGLKILENVPGGGDSMVHSLHIVLKERQQHVGDIGLPVSVDSLRVALVDEVLGSSQRYGIDLTKNRKREFSLMRSPGQLLPEVILLAASNLFQLQVWVHCGMDRPIVHAGSELGSVGSLGRVHLQWLAGVHFNPVGESKEYKPKVFGDASVLESVEREEVVDCVDAECLPVVEVSAQWAQPDCCCGSSSCSSVVVGLGGRFYCALVDTGAQISLIREDAYRSLPEVLKRANDLHVGAMKLRGVGEGYSSVEGVTYLPVALADRELSDRHPFAIVSRQVLPFCVLLGANFIREHRIRVNFASRWLSWLTGVGEVVCQFRPHVSSETRVQFCFQHDVVQETYDRRIGFDSGDLRSMQSRDEVVSAVSDGVLGGVDPDSWTDPKLRVFRRAYDRLLVQQGILYCNVDEKAVPVASFHFLVEVVFTTHRNMAHIGRHKLIESVERVVWHPDIYKVANDVCLSCFRCQTFKVSHQPRPPPVLRIETSVPFELISADLIDFPCSPRRFRTVLMVVDHFSKWLVAVPLQSKRGDAVAHALEHRVLPVLPRCPVRMLSDNGPEFRSSVVGEVLAKFSVAHSFSTPYCPASNGGVERVNRTIAEMLRGLASDRSNWDVNLPRAVMVYNNTTHRSLGMSPSSCLLTVAHDFRVQPLLPADVQEVWKEGHPRFTPFVVGQRVLYRKHRSGNLTVNKLTPLFVGPFVVARVRENRVTYIIRQNCVDGRVLERPVHYKQIKAYREPPGYLREHPCYQLRDGVDHGNGDFHEVPSSSDSDSVPMFVCELGSSEESEGSGSDVSTATLVARGAVLVQRMALGLGSRGHTGEPSSPVASLQDSTVVGTPGERDSGLAVGIPRAEVQLRVSSSSDDTTSVPARSPASCPPQWPGGQTSTPAAVASAGYRSLQARRRKKRPHRREPLRWAGVAVRDLKDLPCSEPVGVDPSFFTDEGENASRVTDVESDLGISGIFASDGCGSGTEVQEDERAEDLGDDVFQAEVLERRDSLVESFHGFVNERGSGGADFAGFEDDGVGSRLHELRRIILDARSAIANNRRNSISRLGDLSSGRLSLGTPVRRMQTRSLGPAEPLQL